MPITHIHSIRHLLMIVSLFVSSFFFSQENTEWKFKNSPKKIIQTFLDKQDTNQLYFALRHINADFINHKKNLPVEKLLHLEEKMKQYNQRELPPLYQTFVYSLLRQHYISVNNRNAYFVNTYKQYQTLLRSENTTQLTWILINIGNLFYEESNFDRARSFYAEAEKIAQKNKHDYALSVVYMNYGLCWYKEKNYQKSIQFLQKATKLRIEDPKGNPKFASFTVLKEADSRLAMNQLDSCLSLLKKAETIYTDLGDETKLLVEYSILKHFSWAKYLERTRKINDAFSEIKKGRQKALDLGLENLVLESYMLELEMAHRCKKFEHANTLFTQTLSLFTTKKQFEDLITIYDIRSTIYAEQNKHKEAFATLQIKQKYIDSLIQQSANLELNALAAIEGIYKKDTELEKSKQAIHLLNLENENVKRRSYFIIGLITTVFVAFAVMYQLYLRVRKARRYTNKLNRNLTQANDLLHVKSEQLELSNQIKNRLISIIGHDLRNPLNRMKVELTMAKRTLKDPVELDSVEKTLSETTALLEQLLNWSKTQHQSARIHPYPTDLIHLLKEVYDFYAPEMERKHILIEFPSKEVRVFVDPNFLKTLIRNIYSNLLTILRGGGNVIVSTKEEKNEITLTFCDNGNGFQTDMIAYFNDPDIDLASVSSGLGLVICKELAQMNQWPIRIYNCDKKGACVEILLPKNLDSTEKSTQ